MDNTSEARKKKMMRRRRVMLRKTHRRINTAFIIVFAILLVLGVRIFLINYTHGEEYSKAVLNHQTYKSTTIPYKRGNITSGDGTVLAYSEKVYNLILDVKSVKSEDGKYLDSTINALVDCFSLDRDKIKQVINDNPESQYQKLLKELSSDEIAGFNELKADKSNNIYGVWFEESYVRKYPFSTLACDVIGYASNVNGGELGLESQYDDELSGTDGVTYSYVDENLNAVETTKSAVNGNNIVTTIDYNVQSIIEKKIVEYNAQKPSVNTGIVVMNPKTGDILAMATYPNYDLNTPFTPNETLSAYKVCVINPTGYADTAASSSSAVAIGTANGSINMTGTRVEKDATVVCTIKGADLKAHSIVNNTDGAYIVGVFGQDLAGVWSLMGTIATYR